MMLWYFVQMCRYLNLNFKNQSLNGRFNFRESKYERINFENQSLNGGFKLVNASTWNIKIYSLGIFYYFLDF
jgi:hypothetical protein